jgi:hypothetical protein
MIGHSVGNSSIREVPGPTCRSDTSVDALCKHDLFTTDDHGSRVNSRSTLDSVGSCPACLADGAERRQTDGFRSQSPAHRDRERVEESVRSSSGSTGSEGTEAGPTLPLGRLSILTKVLSSGSPNRCVCSDKALDRCPGASAVRSREEAGLRGDDGKDDRYPNIGPEPGTTQTCGSLTPRTEIDQPGTEQQGSSGDLEQGAARIVSKEQ